jgi:hypothetical protein
MYVSRSEDCKGRAEFQEADVMILDVYVLSFLAVIEGLLFNV